MGRIRSSAKHGIPAATRHNLTDGRSGISELACRTIGRESDVAVTQLLAGYFALHDRQRKSIFEENKKKGEGEEKEVY
jgi:hypothetical protein